MKAIATKNLLSIVIVILSISSMVGCTRILGISKDEFRGGTYYPTCLVDADRALNDARLAGKDKACPDEFNALQSKVDEAIKVHLGCNTEGACKMARDVVAKAGTLTCQPKPVVEQAPPPEPAPVPAPAPAPAPAPQAKIAVTPASITQGQNAKLNWNSQNATNCDLQPAIGQVQMQGSMEVTPAADTTYTIACSGPGGTASSTASLSVVAPAPEPKPAPKPEELCVSLQIEFATGKSAIPARYHEEIGKVAKLLKEYPQLKGVLEGHTDSRGGKAYNEKLSAQRAQSVKNYLVQKYGIDPARLGVKGYGFSKPVADNATEEGRQKNRRIVANFGCVEKQ